MTYQDKSPWYYTYRALAVFAIGMLLFLGFCSGPTPVAAQTLHSVKGKCMDVETRHSVAEEHGWYLKKEVEREEDLVQLWKQGSTGKLLVIVQHAGNSCVVGAGKEEPDKQV